MKLSVADAKKRLPELIKAAEKGERIIIYRLGQPVAELVRSKSVSQRKPKLGTLRDKVVIHVPEWWKSMTVEEAGDYFEGRY